MKTLTTILKVSAVVGLVTSLTACAFPPVCNPQGAYAQGITDGRYRTPENYNYAATCPNNRGRINHAYHRGYRRGLSMPQPLPAVAIINTAPVFPGHLHHHHWNPQPNPWHPHDHHHHPHPKPQPQPPKPPRPHHHHKIIPGVPTPITHTAVIKPIPVQTDAHHFLTTKPS